MPPPEGPTGLKRSVSFDARQAVWLEDRASSGDIALAQVVRDCVQQAMDREGQEAEAAEKVVDRRPYKTRFLAAMREHYHPDVAADAVGVSMDQLEEWMADEEFATAVEDAQELYCHKVEEALVAQGRFRANATALIAFLNARDNAWGRIKVELLNRIFNPVFDSFAEVVKRLAPGPLAEKILKEFAEIRELRWSQFSE